MRTVGKHGWTCVQTSTHFLQHKCIQEVKNWSQTWQICSWFVKICSQFFLAGLLVYNLKKKITK